MIVRRQRRDLASRTANDERRLALLLANNQALAQEISRLRLEKVRYERQILVLSQELSKARRATPRQTKATQVGENNPFTDTTNQHAQNDELMPPAFAPRSLRTLRSVSYAEPSLKAKLRQP